MHATENRVVAALLGHHSLSPFDKLLDRGQTDELGVQALAVCMTSPA